jgi:hypothetical protein
MGRPTIPSLVVDGRAVPILHVSQIAEALGLPPPPRGSPVRDGADAAAILDAWLGRIRETPWSALLAPTPARGRCLRELTVNVFHPFELLPPAWTSGELDWRPEDDGAREAELASHDDLIAFAEAAATGWRRFVDDHDLAGRDPLVDTPRGSAPFSTLLAFHRWHAAYHYRQLVSVLGDAEGALDLDELDDLALPSDVF